MESRRWYIDNGNYYLAEKIQQIMEKRYSNNKKLNAQSLTLISNNQKFDNQQNNRVNND